MAALFGGATDSRREPKSLVEFRAGKMKLSGSTVTADTRKGLVYLKLAPEDGLLHFYWKDRKSSEVVDDLTIVPGSAELKRVTQCKTGRVLLLKFKDLEPSRKFFYWLQEPKDDKDEDYIKKVNDLIENPPDPSADTLGGGGPHGLPQGLLGPHGSSLSPQLLEQLISSGMLSPHPGMLSSFEGASQGAGGAGASGTPSSSASASTSNTGGGRPASSTATTGTSQQTPSSSRTTQQQPQQQPPPARQQVQLGDLQSILSSMNIPQPEQKPKEEQVSLTDVVTPEVLRPLSRDSAAVEQISPHLPATSESAEAVLASPQFQQALGVFGSALQSGQLGPLMSEFGLGQPVVDAANTGDVQGFARALQGGGGGNGGGASGGSEEKEKESSAAAGKDSKKKDSSKAEQEKQDS